MRRPYRRLLLTIALFIAIMTVGASYGSSSIVSVLKTVPSISSTWLKVTRGWFCVVFFDIYMPIIALMSNFIMVQSFEGLAIVLDKLAGEIARGRLETSEVLHLGFRTQEAIGLANRAFEWPLVLELTLFAETLICGIFFGVLIFAKNDVRPESTIFTEVGVGNGCVALISLFRLISIFYSGEKVRSKARKAVEALEDCNLERSLDHEEGKRMETLLARFWRDGAIRPFDSFDVSFPSAISYFGILFTYLVILMQFRSSDLSGSGCDLSGNGTVVEE